MNPSANESRSLIRALQSTFPEPTAEAAARSAARALHTYRQRAPHLDWAQMETPIGQLHLAAGPDGLQQIDLHRNESDFLASLEPRSRLRRDGRNVRPAVHALQSYFARGPRDFDLALDLRATTEFQRKVLQSIRSIPPGQVWSYGQVAERIGVPGAARAVGQALGANPLPIVVPCHRVIASDGSLGGYTGGLQTKEFLLRHEGAR